MAESVCVVYVPSGEGRDAGGTLVDYDSVFSRLVLPAASAAGLDVLRFSAESFAAACPKEMLLICERAIVDVSAASAPLMFEVGARHIVRPGTTVLLMS